MVVVEPRDKGVLTANRVFSVGNGDLKGFQRRARYKSVGKGGVSYR